MTLTESIIEQAALDWFSRLDYQVAFGPDLAFDGCAPERENYQTVVLHGRLQDALRRINPTLPEEALQEAIHQLTRPDQPSLLLNNHALHQLLVQGIPVDYRDKEGRVISGRAWALDFQTVENND